ncbi:MAG: hypothetical protein Fur0015_11100 [Ignavibacteriales bacterium]
MSSSNPIRRIFDLYTSDLTLQEIERLIKKESTAVYEFYKNEMPTPQTNRSKFIRGLIFTRSLFNAFLLKMNAARRIFYILALLLFFLGFANQNGSYLITSFLIVNLLLAFEMADKLTAKDELELASKIQSSLLPSVSPTNQFYEIASYYKSAKEVGGDYFDFIYKDDSDEKLFVAIGDISGKGMAAALYTIRVQAILQFLINNFSSIPEIMINLKKYFSRKLRKEYFLTIMLSSINSDGSLSICRAGHMPALHYRAKEKQLDILNPKGIGIGLNDKGAFEKTLEEITIHPEKDDLVFFYTDGVIDAMNIDKVQFGEERLRKIITEKSSFSAEDLKEYIVKYLEYFTYNASQNDDFTLIVLKKSN